MGVTGFSGQGERRKSQPTESRYGEIPEASGVTCLTVTLIWSDRCQAIILSSATRFKEVPRVLTMKDLKSSFLQDCAQIPRGACMT